jgi:hypothetical protein
MKTIPLEQLNEKLTKALEEQDQHEALGLTNGQGGVGWLLVRVPEFLKDTEADVVTMGEGQQGRIVIQAKIPSSKPPESNGKHPVFGAGRGTLTIVSDDDDHLKDFQDYTK